MDSTGCVYIADRIKELIKYKGYQVPQLNWKHYCLHTPLFLTLPSSASPTPQAREIPKAFVVTADPAMIADEVMTFVAAQDAPYRKGESG